MIQHLIKLIWNKRSTHALVIIEIWASFMVLFGVLSLIVYNLSNYMQPIGFNYESVWKVDLRANQDTVDIDKKLQNIARKLRSYPEIESVTRMSSNTPFSGNQMSNGFSYNKKDVSPDHYVTDPEFFKTLDLEVIQGKPYSVADRVSKFTPIVINKATQQKLFEQENPIGKVMKKDKEEMRVVGVVNTFKAKGEFMEDKPAVFELIGANDTWNNNFLIKIKPGVDAHFEARLVKDVTAMVKDWGIEVVYLTDSHQMRTNLTKVPVIIFLVVSGFLLSNVALGLFGILNLNIAKRKNEIGLRRAMGSTDGKIMLQFLGEMWVLALFSILLGLLFAIQFPILNVFDMAAHVYISAMLGAIVVIFVLVTLCAWYPSRQAAKIQPASALHEE